MTHDPLTLATAALLASLGTARAVRLVTHDDWPPMLWLRLRWLTWAAQTPRRQAWADLLQCPFCFAPYAAAVNLAWGVAALTHLGRWWADGWWLVNTWAALAYVAAIIVKYDEPATDEEE